MPGDEHVTDTFSQTQESRAVAFSCLCSVPGNRSGKDLDE